MDDIISTTEHSHDQDENKVEAAKLKGVMKEQVIADNVVQVPVKVRAALDNLESL